MPAGRLEPGQPGSGGEPRPGRSRPRHPSQAQRPRMRRPALVYRAGIGRRQPRCRRCRRTWSRAARSRTARRPGQAQRRMAQRRACTQCRRAGRPGSAHPCPTRRPGPPPGAGWPGDRGATEAGGLGDPTRGSAAMSGAARPGAARRHGGGRLGTARAELPGSRAAGTPRQRPGWYAYRVVGPAKVPSWAAEIALTIERPANRGRGGAGDRTRAAARSGSTGSRGPKAGARPGRQGPPGLGSPAPMLEPAGAPAPGWAGGQVQASLGVFFGFGECGPNALCLVSPMLPLLNRSARQTIRRRH
jgi:hypothetical protein